MIPGLPPGIFEGSPVMEPVRLADGWPDGLLDDPERVAEMLRAAVPELTRGRDFHSHTYVFCTRDPVSGGVPGPALYGVGLRALRGFDQTLAGVKLHGLLARALASFGGAVGVAMVSLASQVDPRTRRAESAIVAQLIRRGDAEPITWMSLLPGIYTGSPIQSPPPFRRLPSDGAMLDLSGFASVLDPLPPVDALAACAEITKVSPLHLMGTIDLLSVVVVRERNVVGGRERWSAEVRLVAPADHALGDLGWRDTEAQAEADAASALAALRAIGLEPS